ncbi:oxidoreductase FAD-binding protein [Aspergillus nomiae NRRL 13137]|uniref:Oxidoreductase FAD-binding protein n=1 Tax=Aspergillus nomiae NRRL (strain ATCC 15546 / NRRL 13137 / CBS 260.88 / M93) TaxID=1509407 RepID=A0A0L1J3K0_ASPN3|nr:oxidoreductase FAD-binding protein [Aspergillus nomiae NRRL 13137]KNG86329.1 oxidoreductase FAD-binding protein [Aspergillus nomiae NRRL 13137]
MEQLPSAGNTTNGNIGNCCLALASVLGSKVSFPNTQPYNDSISTYFSQQNCNLHPLCIVSPTTAEDVATAINTITSTLETTNFAIRSGGHAPFTGASNIANGITLDLRGLDSITVSSDRTTASIGVGATWGEVYSHLDPLGLSVAGGRAAQVGVGGLTTGGGISYFSPRYGWTCDTVTNFEVVLANGTIVNANEHENPDLLIALRGGSSNFGVVTRIDLKAFEQGPIWGGSVYNSIDTYQQNLEAFADVNAAEGYDEFASLITSFGYSAQGKAIVNSIVYTKAEENPAVFRRFMEIPKLFGTVRIAGMHEIVTEQGSFSKVGKRQMTVVTTHGSTLPMLEAVYQRWDASLADVDAIPGMVWAISLEPLPQAIYARNASKNALGLDDVSGPLVVTLLSATWDNESDDEKVEKAARELFDNIDNDARKLGLYEPFVYLNYAAQWQDPISSYKSKNVELLKRVSEEVDPRRMFQTIVPGGFKLPKH